MPCYNALDRAVVFLVLFGVAIAAPVQAASQDESITVQSAQLKQVGDHWVLNAEFAVRLNRTQEEALRKGVTLHFVTDLELERIRSWWLNESLTEANRIGRLNYSPLTRRFHVETIEGFKAYDSMEEALAGLGHIENWVIAPRKLMKSGQRYLAAVRMRLDLGLLSKPLQINALTTGKWDVEGDWYEWEIAGTP
jgi:phage gp46-like protein